MKKTLTVNIGGMVFHIDEDAYNVLNDYLQSIKKNFSQTKGGDEIISDIEARIAEMLKERIGDDRQVITIDDIEVIIQVIGQPSEFGEEFTEASSRNQASGTGKSTKRLYRDPDNSILGGVCGGLGAYFHTDPVWFRLAFVLLSIIGIGTPGVVYVVLWIVVPEAKTAAERLEMKGEKVDISSIENSIKEEINNLKHKFNDFTEGARQTYKKKRAVHRSGLMDAGNAFGRLLELFVKIVLVFVGVILFLFGLSFIIALLIMFFGFGHNIFIMDSELVYVSFPSMVEFFIGPAGNSIIFQTAFLLLIGIPILMLLYGGVKLIFGLEKTRFVGITAFNIWFVALLVTGYYGFKVFKSFSHSGVFKESIVAEMPVGQPLKLEVAENEDFNKLYKFEEYFEIDEANMIITSDERDFYYGIPRLEIVQGSGSGIEVEVFYRARGKSDFHAEQRAKSTLYNFSVTDSVMLFDRFFKLAEHEVWREQKVDIVVKVPVGCRIQITDNMKYLLGDRTSGSSGLPGATWVMTESGLERVELNTPAIREGNVGRESGNISHHRAETRKGSISGILYADITNLPCFIV